MTDASPTWGQWVTHFDSIGQASSMSLSFNEPSNTILSLLFDRMVLSCRATINTKWQAPSALPAISQLHCLTSFRLLGICLLPVASF
jgi:hypothetical protein